MSGNGQKAVARHQPEPSRVPIAAKRPASRDRTTYTIGSYILVFAAVFLAGMLVGPWLFGPGQLPTGAVEQIQQEMALLDEAAAMALFWERRHARMWKAAFTRFDWTAPELQRALVRLEEYQREFKAVESAIDQWGTGGNTITILKERMQALQSRIASFCKEFGLDCPRGYPPDQATVRRARYQALGPTPGEPSNPRLIRPAG